MKMETSVAEANVGEDLLFSLSRDDIKDLFPGPENFLRRRTLWLAVHKREEVSSVILLCEKSENIVFFFFL